MSVERCCTKFKELSGAKSPFTIAFVLDYYDGTLSGVVQCAACKKYYRFGLIGSDLDLSLRVFAIFEVSAEVLPKLHVVKESSALSEDVIWEKLNHLLLDAGQDIPALVIACSEIEGTILVARKPSAEESIQIIDALKDYDNPPLLDVRWIERLRH